MNMLIAEYDYDTDIAVQREEEREMAFAEGEAKGIVQGFSDGSRHAKLETAKNLRGLGLSIENIAQATGLSKEEVKNI